MDGFERRIKKKIKRKKVEQYLPNQNIRGRNEKIKTNQNIKTPKGYERI